MDPKTGVSSRTKSLKIIVDGKMCFLIRAGISCTHLGSVSKTSEYRSNFYRFGPYRDLLFNLESLHRLYMFYIVNSIYISKINLLYKPG